MLHYRGEDEVEYEDVTDTHEDSNKEEQTGMVYFLKHVKKMPIKM